MNGVTRGDLDIGYVERAGAGWSAPVRLGDEVNSPADAVEAARATLGGAIAEAEHLTADTAIALRTAAREAFLRGLRLTAWISAAGTLALAAFAAVSLRRTPAATQLRTGSPSHEEPIQAAAGD